MLDLKPNTIATALMASFAVAGLAAILVFGGVLPPYAGRAVDLDHYGEPEFAFTLSSFDELEGWREDDQSAALTVFLRSCTLILRMPAKARANPSEALGGAYAGLSIAGAAADWRPACEAARALGEAGEVDARAAQGFFEEYFRPLKILNLRKPDSDGPEAGRASLVGPEGLYTGYFEPVYLAAPRRTQEFSAPLYARPRDLVMVDLGAFRDDLAGERIAGSVEAGRLVPYPDHKAINAGALGDRARALAWLDPNDLFFLQIQGSGRLRLFGSGEMRVGYDGQNGKPYTAIGKTLIDRGVLTLDNVSMRSIRGWLAAAPPEEARALREENASYVFFRVLDNLPDPALGPFGAEGVQLTPGRSLAVDRRYHALGAPVWVSLREREDGPVTMRRLMIAQDTGGAIRGPVRGDVFFGAGPEAARLAGGLRAKGEMTVLAPTPVAERLAAAASPAS